MSGAGAPGGAGDLEPRGADVGFNALDFPELLARSRSVTPSIALRLAKFFNTSPDFWLNLQ